MKQKPLILIDGSSYLYRAFHALPPLTNTKGVPTGAVYGVMNMIRRLIKDYEPEHIAVVFDAKGKTFRDELYPEYKAHRPPMPDDLRVQIKPLHDLIKALGLPMLVVEGVEADDVIGTLAVEATKRNLPTLISTGDKDMAQLVNDHVTLINTMNNALLDRDGVFKKYGVTPEQIIDYLSLMGDVSDNVPGVPKVGPKTAAKWLSEYDNLENIVKNADDFQGKIGEHLRDSLKQLPLSKQLVEIKIDVPLGMHPDDLKPKAPDHEALTKLYKELNFKTWLSELLKKTKPGEATQAQNERTYHTILDQASLDTWLVKLKDAKQFAFDTETTDLDTLNAEIVGASFALTADEAIYIPLSHDYAGAPKQLNRNTVLNAIKPLLADKTKTIIGHNLKYDISVLDNYDITIDASIRDTMLESYVLNSTASRHNMDALALKYLGKPTTHFEDIAGKGKNQLTFNEIPIDQASPYAAEDADITWQLDQTLWPQIKSDKGLKNILLNIEIPLIKVLARMERLGVCIDKKALEIQSKELGERIEAIEKEVFDIAGESFNISSPKQLQEVLFEKLKLPIIKKTPTGQPSTAEPVLQELAHDFPIPKVILEFRSLSKLKSTYTDSLPLQIHEKTGRIHTSYNQAVTATGRLSSTNPNLQNIPVRTEEGRRIRQAFIAPEGYQIVSADYSQIELRIMAHLSQDKGLLKAFENGWDIHQATAAEVFGVELNDVTHEQRRSAKAINFGLIYGMSAFGLSRQLDTAISAAQEYIDLYFHRYPEVKKYMENAREKAHKQGYVETHFGRRLYTPDINASNKMRRNAAERAAINAPMQGTAADIMKLAMINVDAWIQTTDLDIKMIMQVHDELVFEVAKEDVTKASEEILSLMENAAKLDVPLEVAVGVGDNWDEAH